MGWGEEEAKRRKEQLERKRRQDEAAQVHQKMLPQMLEDTWTALLVQVKADFRDYTKGGGPAFECIDQNPNNLLVVALPARRYQLDIWRETDHSVIKYNWTDESGVHHKGLQLQPPEDIEQLSQMVCRDFVAFLNHHS